MVGKKFAMGNHMDYIRHYVEESKMTMVSACLMLVGSVEKVLKEILKK